MHSQQLKSSNLKQPVCGKRAVVRSSHVTPEQFRRECGRAHSSPTTESVARRRAEKEAARSSGRLLSLTDTQNPHKKYRRTVLWLDFSPLCL